MTDCTVVNDSPAWGLIAVLGWEGELPISYLAVASDQTLEDLLQIFSLPPVPDREWLDNVGRIGVENEKKFRRGELEHRIGGHPSYECQCLPPAHLDICLHSVGQNQGAAK